MVNIFDEIYNYENTILNGILGNQNLLKYLGDENTYEILSKPDIDDPYSLLDKNIYFQPRVVDETTDTVKTFLLINFDISEVPDSKAYTQGLIIFDIIVHNSINFITIDGNKRKRSWNICGELHKYMSGKDGIGIKKTQLKSNLPLNMGSNSYNARRMIYRFADFSGFNYTDKS